MELKNFVKITIIMHILYTYLLNRKVSKLNVGGGVDVVLLKLCKMNMKGEK